MRKTCIYLFSLTFSFHVPRSLYGMREDVDFINRYGSPWFFPAPCPNLSANTELFLLL